MAKNIGKNIANARINAGLTQEELAKKVGYQSKSAVNKIETGLRDLPQKKISAFAEALGVTPGYLLGWDKSKPDEQGRLIAQVLKDQEVARMVQDYMSLSTNDQALVRSLVASLVAKKKD